MNFIYIRPRLRKLLRGVSGGKPGQCRPRNSDWRGGSCTWIGSELWGNEACLICWSWYVSISIPSRCFLLLRSRWIGDGRVLIAVTMTDVVTVVDAVTDEAVRVHEYRYLRDRMANHPQTTLMYLLVVPGACFTAYANGHFCGRRFWAFSWTMQFATPIVGTVPRMVLLDIPFRVSERFHRWCYWL